MKHSNNSVDSSLITGIVIFAAISPAMLLIAPVAATQLGGELSLSPSEIGALFSIELGAMSFATIPAYWWLSRWNCQWVAVVSCLVFIIANVASALFTSYSLLLIWRSISGLAGGSLMILCLASAAGAPNKGRVYGLWTMGQLVLGTLGLALMPILFKRFGISALFWAFALLMFLSVPWSFAFPKLLHKAETKKGVDELDRAGAAIGIIGTLIFYISLSGIWTFMGSIAEKSGISTTLSGNILSLATILGIIGSGCAVLIGDRIRRQFVLLLGYLLMALSIGLLVGTPQIVRFIVAAFIFKYAWTFVLPYILSCLADVDASGQLMNTTNIVIGGGLAVGPLITGEIIEKTNSITISIIIGVLFALLSMILMLIVDKRSSRNVIAPFRVG